MSIPDSLFPSAGAWNTAPAEPLPPSAAAPVPDNPGEAAAELWRGYWAACKRFKAELDGCCARASRADIDARPDMQGALEAYTFAEKIARDLVKRAGEHFRGPGCVPLMIEEDGWVRRFVRDPYRDLHPRQRHDLEIRKAGTDASFFDPAGLWAALEEAFGNGMGAEIGRRQAAAQIRKCFGLHPGVAVQRRRHGVVLSLTVWLDADHRCELSADSKQELYLLRDALSAFAAWADDDGTLLAGLGALLRRFGWHWREFVTSREKIHLCAALSVVTYKNRFEFVMASALAEQLQLFLALYDPVIETPLS